MAQPLWCSAAVPLWSVIPEQFLHTSAPPPRCLTFKLCECPPVEDLGVEIHKALKLGHDVQTPKDKAVDFN